MRRLALLLALLSTACAGGDTAGGGASCASDTAHWARAAGGCLAMQSYGPERAEVLFVVLHGDVSSGGPATYHRAFARRVAETVPGATAFALIRPGYDDGEGRTSAGELNNRSDHYTAANVALVAEAVAGLRQRTGARRVVAIGHSGGAAMAADILALHPGTFDGAVLLACPCNLAEWRTGRTPWLRSVSPHSVAARVPVTARVVAYTGSADTNTAPSQAAGYVAALAARGVPARFTAVPGATHNGVVEAVWSTDYPQALLAMTR
ncbi:alpha/beta hydrolase [Muricoccus radiodurans]|uniref:alpha/beta hydrolase n=1 Tax=Muricoccus radiodurans TaxID=2231721 RepID=UPI003CE93D88